MNIACGFLFTNNICNGLAKTWDSLEPCFKRFQRTTIDKISNINFEAVLN